MRYLLLTAALFLTLTGCGGSEPEAAPDDVYVAFLKDEGIIPTYGDRETALTLGHQLCDRYDRGDSFVAVIETLSESGIPDYEAGQINGAATAAFCPEYDAP